MENKNIMMESLSLEQVKAEAKKRFNKDLTDEQAKAWLEKQADELTDEDLEAVAGGFLKFPIFDPRFNQSIKKPGEKQS